MCWYNLFQTYAEQELQWAGVIIQPLPRWGQHVPAWQRASAVLWRERKAASPHGMNSLTSAMGVPPCAKLTQGKGIETCMPGRWKPAATGQRQTVHKPLPGRCSLRWQLCLPAGISQYCQGTWGCSTTCEMTTFCSMSPFFLLINTHSKENKWFDVGNAQTFFWDLQVTILDMKLYILRTCYTF